MLKIKRRNSSSLSANRPRLLGTGAILIGLAGSWLFGHYALQKERSTLVTESAQSLEELGELTQQMFLAEEEKLDGLLIRVRSDLRADGHWARESSPQPASDLSAPDPSADSPDDVRQKEIEVQLGEGVTDDRWRKVRADMKRGVNARVDIRSLELVVADQAGLTAVRVLRTENGLDEELDDPRADKGIAKAIWYADEVRRAVAANGRRVERGAQASAGAGESERAIMRVALALHDPSELVQGVLVATVDLAPVADSLVALAGSGIDARIISLDGRVLNSSEALIQAIGAEADIATRIGPERDSSLAARIATQEGDEGAFEADQYLVNGFPLSYSDGRASESILLMEKRLPPDDLLAQASTPWGMGLIALTLLSGLAIALLIRRGTSEKDSPSVGKPKENAEASRSLSRAKATDAVEALAEPSASGSESGLALARKEIDLREWLGDVRGCLERDAATRGLSLNLKCERSLPRSIVQDPGWLGGLLIAMGQEALDATSEDRIFLRIREEAHEVLRFEVDAGPINLSPVDGMRVVADKLGGRFESGPEGELAFLMPLA